MLIEKFQEYRKPLYIAFIDYQKAFDSLKHEAIWKALQKLKIKEPYVRILKFLYENSTSKVRLDSTGPSIPINRGVKQGDPLSPKIFIAVLEFVMSTLQWDKLGIYVNGKYFNHLRFADDIAIFSESSAQMQDMLSSLNETSRDAGLEINFGKSKLMTNSNEIPIKIENTCIEYVKKYIYLGKQISFVSNNNEEEVERRIKMAWSKYWSLKDVFKSNMPINLKSKIMNTCVLPTLTYGCQTWKFTKKIKRLITSCQRAMERSILKIRKIHKIRHSSIRLQTKLKDALIFTLTAKWRWAGHVARLTDNRWTINLTSWPGPRGTRGRGRPHYRWDRDIVKVAGPNWMTLARDRKKWLSLEEALT